MNRDPDIIRETLEAAWFSIPLNAREAPDRAKLMSRVMAQLTAAYDAGERDHQRLIRAALDGIATS